MSDLPALPGRLAEVVEEFASTPREMRLELLLEYSEKVPPLPESLAGDRTQLERVVECQTPFFVAVDVDSDDTVHIHFDAPPEAPTVRGFAGILVEGLDGVSVKELLETPLDISSRLGLGELVSPMRLSGMSGIMRRMKRLATEAASKN